MSKTALTSTPLLLGFLLFLVVFQQIVTIDQSSLLVRAFLNSAHTPWFFLVSLVLWALIRKQKKINLIQQVTIFTVTILLLSVGLEAVQIFNSRQASWSDVLRNLSGAVAAVFCILAINFWRRSKRGDGVIFSLLAAAVFMSGFSSVGGILLLRAQQAAQAPVLVGFNESEAVTLRGLRGSWDIEHGIEGWPEYSDQRVGKIALSSQSRWPGLILREPLRDWRPYNWLVIEAYLTSHEPIELDVRLETFSDRGLSTIYSIALIPGANTLRIPLSELTSSGQSPANVKNLLLYKEFDGNLEEFFFLGQLRLE